MEASATPSEMPTRAAFVEPYVVVARWDSPRQSHPPLEPVFKIAQTLITHFERIARMQLPPTEWKFLESAQVASAVEAKLVMLESMRDLYRLLTESEAMKLLDRDIVRFAPALAPKFARVKSEAVAQIGELRAALAFCVGATDDIDLGFSFVPEVGEPLEPEDCCAPTQR